MVWKLTKITTTILHISQIEQPPQYWKQRNMLVREYKKFKMEKMKGWRTRGEEYEGSCGRENGEIECVCV